MRYPLLGVAVAFFLPIAGGSVARAPEGKPSSAIQPFHPTNEPERRWHDRFRQAYNLDRERRYIEAIAILKECLELADIAQCAPCRLRTPANLAGGQMAATQHREALRRSWKLARYLENRGSGDGRRPFTNSESVLNRYV
jgi:hypothetical protein